MRRAATKQSRGPNSVEDRFRAWVKEQGCVICFLPGPSIVDHMFGSATKVKINLVTEIIGHLALLPYCPGCDQAKTDGSPKAHFKAFGFTQQSLFRRFVDRYPGREEIPEEKIVAIESWRR